MVIHFITDPKTQRVISMKLDPSGGADELFLTSLLQALIDGEVTTESSRGSHVYRDGAVPESDDE